ncbi:MAG TPA: hypothetical protein PK690_05530, partial [Emcibacteraceae bacterium]|nr:hypothetical protein [Emcibacteraceae bacterium]
FQPDRPHPDHHNHGTTMIMVIWVRAVRLEKLLLMETVFMFRAAAVTAFPVAAPKLMRPLVGLIILFLPLMMPAAVPVPTGPNLSAAAARTAMVHFLFMMERFILPEQQMEMLMAMVLRVEPTVLQQKLTGPVAQPIGSNRSAIQLKIGPPPA